MSHYTIIESRVWVNAVTGQRASVYGAVPYTSERECGQWALQTVGWTVRNNHNGTVGIGRRPWDTREEAQEWVDADTARRDTITTLPLDDGGIHRIV